MSLRYWDYYPSTLLLSQIIEIIEELTIYDIHPKSIFYIFVSLIHLIAGKTLNFTTLGDLIFFWRGLNMITMPLLCGNNPSRQW